MPTIYILCCCCCCSVAAFFHLETFIASSSSLEESLSKWGLEKLTSLSSKWHSCQLCFQVLSSQWHLCQLGLEVVNLTLHAALSNQSVCLFCQNSVKLQWTFAIFGHQQYQKSASLFFVGAGKLGKLVIWKTGIPEYQFYIFRPSFNNIPQFISVCLLKLFKTNSNLSLLL